jgi:putative PIN family toxin of toxin-antitoxin system
MTPAVIDIGVLVSGVSWRHEPHQCVQAWLRGLLTLVVSDSIFAEYERVLREVKAEQGFTTDLDPTLAALQKSALWVAPEPLARPVGRDRKDDQFIEAALAGKARLLIAQDADLTVLEKPFGVEIVKPLQLLARLPRQVRRRLE